MNWSNISLKMTLGIGSLAQTAIMADPLKPLVGVWGLIAIILIPFALVVMIKIGDDLPPWLIKYAHATSALWYAALTIATLAIMAIRGFERTDILMGLMIAAGLVPCVVILRSISAGNYDAYDDIHNR